MDDQPVQKKEIHLRSVFELKPAEYNPRRLTEDQRTQLKKSIEKFELVEPIIVNQNDDRKDVIVGGHMRVLIAQELGITEVPCIYVDLSFEEERELNIRLNKNTGEWDHDKLSSHFDNEFLLDLGFKEFELGMGDSDLDTDEPELDRGESNKKTECPSCGHLF
jgi:hypothetical protein